MSISLAAALLFVPATLAPPAHSHAPRAARSAVPPGSYSTALTRADFPSTVGPNDVAEMLARWTFTFDRTGHYTVDHDTAMRVVRGRIRTTGPTVHFDANDIRDAVCHVPGTYTVSADAHALRFRKIADECEVRAIVLTAHPLLRG